MALGPVLATQIQTIAAHPWGLFVAGADVIRSSPVENVRVSNRGPDSPGSMSWTTEDTAGTYTFSEGDEVRLHNFTADKPVFLGFVETVTYRPWPAGVGRWIDVTAVDVDILLDWLVLPADAPNFSISNDMALVIQSLVALCQGVGFPLRAMASTVANTPSTQALPIQTMAGTITYPTITRGTSLRAALGVLRTYSNFVWPVGTSFIDFIDPQFMVDEYGGLRAWGKSSATDLVLIPTDWATVTIVDTTAGAVQASGLSHTIDGTNIIRSLVLIGSDFVRTYNDGSGRPGKMAVVTDTTLSTLTSIYAVNAYAKHYLDQFGARYRGTIPIEDWTPTTGAHVGGLVDLTDANAGATGIYTIGQIDRTFHGSGREDWTLTYGGPAASGANLLRRLTRSVLN